jgi:hypothetical protein
LETEDWFRLAFGQEPPYSLGKLIDWKLNMKKPELKGIKNSLLAREIN